KVNAKTSSIEPLVSDEVIPDVVDKFKPEAVLNIKYGKKKVEFGNEFTVEDTQQAPNVSFVLDKSDYDNKCQYTLVMNPTLRESLHWIVGNIPSNGKLSKATQFDDYIGPAPPSQTGFHRYVFLLYRQPVPHIEYPQLNDSARLGFKTRQFAEQYGLKLISANYFKCKRD
ncbi:1901_t:CDS:2, partial [Racocetra persica]